MSAIRPGTASRLKSAQIQGKSGTACRVTDGAKTGARGRTLGGTTLNTMVCVEDRPITQQGLGGIKNPIRGPKRQIEDKSYFLGLLRGKINEINSEVGNITRQLVEKEEDNASFVQYEQMAEKLAYEIKELQGELGDYNTLVDKATLGNNITSIEMDLEDVRAANERAERNLEMLFEDRQRKESSLKSCELELKQEQEMSEIVIQEMVDTERERYFKLKDLNIHLLNQLSEGQMELERLNTRKAELEEELLTSPIKQEAVRLFTQLHEIQSRRDQLLSEEAAKTDPQIERQRLLQQVKSDNQEIAAIDKQTHEIQEKITNKEEELHLLEQQLDENYNERNQKYRELKKREQQIDEFLQTFDHAKSLEISGINEMESTIIEILNKTSNSINNFNQITSNLDVDLSSVELIIQQDKHNNQMMNNTIQYLNNNNNETEEVFNHLTKERIRLNQDLLKVDHLQSKITQEMETLKKRISKMEEEIVIFSDLDKVRENAVLKRQSDIHWVS
ncbi:Intraflagellar transport protein 74 [Schistosoma haematobium]|uniref:Intraflagellar transport protein 74 n=1 Tax=Schistosoma haematobium TaxID=6185 RepID=A0A922IIC2_SCHHA|nr:Intraflagellar transport protein 74 [Schistosoma haematobium]KAH9579353.1 Intraflagellar transport protein 74 [Schistosoma haematobium]CAH8638854.1 unnamed protein product [Schistosoma haematobium]